MKKKFLPLLIITWLLAGCGSIEETLSEEEAKQLVISHHTNGNGSPTIVSIEVKNNAYIVVWENKENLEGGTSKVTKDGEVKIIEAYIH